MQDAVRGVLSIVPVGPNPLRYEMMVSRNLTSSSVVGGSFTLRSDLSIDTILIVKKHDLSAKNRHVLNFQGIGPERL